MLKPQVTESKSLEDTESIARDFLKVTLLKEKNLWGLQGNLGSGKTTFVQALAKILGIQETVQSPTYVIQKTYFINSPEFPHIKTLYHLDLYRIEHPSELAMLHLEEICADSANLVCIEWPEKAEGSLPKNMVLVHFEFINETTRRISYLI